MSASKNEQHRSKVTDYAYCGFLTLCIVLNLANYARLYATGSLSVVRQDNVVRATDFVNFYVVGTLVRLDRANSYNWSAQKKYLDPLIKPAVADEPPHIHYVPFVFLLMYPFSFLPLDLAHVIWDLLGVTLALGALFMLGSLMPKPSKHRRLLLAAGVVACMPAWFTFITGQISWLLLAAASAYAWSLLRANDTAGGITLALAAVKPQYLPFLTIPAFLEKRWKLLTIAAITELLLLVFSGGVLGLNNILGYPMRVLKVDSTVDQGAERMVCLRGILSDCLTAKTATMVSLILMVSALLAIIWLFARLRRKSAGKYVLSWEIALTVVSALVFSPHTHYYDCLLLAIPAYLTIADPRIRSLEAVKDPSFRLWCTLLILYPVLTWLIFILTESSVALRSVLLSVIQILLLISGFAAAFGQNSTNLRIDAQAAIS